MALFDGYDFNSKKNEIQAELTKEARREINKVIIRDMIQEDELLLEELILEMRSEKIKKIKEKLHG